MRLLNVGMGFRFTLDSPDRVWLHDWVRGNCVGKSVLNVGVSWYTMLLPELADSSVWTTIDVNEEAADFGSTSYRHFTADLAKDASCIQQDGCEKLTYDVVIANGVFGCWGIDSTAKAEAALANVVSVMQPGSTLLVGYNDCAAGISYDLRQLICDSDYPLQPVRYALADAHNAHTFVEYVLH